MTNVILRQNSNNKKSYNYDGVRDLKKIKINYNKSSLTRLVNPDVW
jgi:hypothetical protein